MIRWLAKQLVMPKPDGTIEQLAGRHQKWRVPQNIVETRTQSPRAQGMEQHLVRIRRFIPVILVPQFLTVVAVIKKLTQLVA
jgi:hypothetical protein